MRSQIRSLAVAAMLGTAILISNSVPFANAATLSTADAATNVQTDWRPCIQGYVWRAARPGDVIRVLPATRNQAGFDNRMAASRRDPNGAYGPMSCKSGFVWREAWDGDTVCVTPATRTQTKHDNATEVNHRVHLSW